MILNHFKAIITCKYNPKVCTLETRVGVDYPNDN